MVLIPNINKNLMEFASADLFISKREYSELQKKRVALKTAWRDTQHELGDVISGSSSFVNKTPGFDETEMQLHRVEEQIHQIDELLSHTRLLTSPEQLALGIVTIYSEITTERTDTGEKITYYLQHQLARDPKRVVVTPASPIGQKLLGHKIGDVVNIKLPERKLTLKITKITKSL